MGQAPNKGKKNAAALAIGNGNLLSNLGIVGWVDGRLLKVAWEEKRIASGWEYSCFYVTKEGAVGVGRFVFGGPSPEPLEELKGELAWAASGQPILWDGNIARPEAVIAETYDVRHVYRLPTIVGSLSQKTRALQIVGNLTELWVDQLDQPFAEATARLQEFATRNRLVTESRYLMSGLGADENGHVYIVQRQGSVSELARSLRDLGATRAILLDQGGSVGTFYWSEKHCPDGSFILRSRNLRPERLCVIIFEVADSWNEA